MYLDVYKLNLNYQNFWIASYIEKSNILNKLSVFSDNLNIFSAFNDPLVGSVFSLDLNYNGKINEY